MADVSFMDNENEMVIDAVCQEIAEHLFEEWNSSNLDEGILYADWRIAQMTDSNYLRGRFNQHWELTPDDEYYLEWDEEA